ncbi:MAG: pyruvate dehydrogenase (acetyl-transferring) E1 component subunit alpha [Deltaproteobacteria bacterium]|nr:pyruvate dehydrogenase (acetyl-transferring) E1 component subunit alpha [Deltaproteobacteria bacterium]
MPKGTITLESIETLSILDEHGHVDEKLLPKLTPEELLKAYRFMLFGRRLDEQAMRYQRQGRIGTFGPNIGQEAAQVGSAMALADQDWFIPSFRELGVWLWRGLSTQAYFMGHMGFEDASTNLKGAGNLPMAVPVATQCCHAAGIAWGIKIDKKKAAAVVYFGDGATSEGSFHEALNFCGTMHLPAVFFCQNNQWAISTPLKKQTASGSLAQKAVAYGVKGVQVDGNDVFAVYVAAQEALERARNGKGATLIEALTFRKSVHTTADDPTVYRTIEEERLWESKDPLSRFKKYLESKNFLNEKKNHELEEKIAQEIKQGYEKAEEFRNSNPDPLSYFDYVYERMPAYLQWQKETAQSQCMGRNMIKGATEAAVAGSGAAAVGQLEEAAD